MITFKEFLAEKVIKKWESQNLTVRKAIDILNTSHRDGLSAISNGGLLFRGNENAPDAIHTIDPRTGIRTSRDSNSLYQLAMERSTALQDYPSRSKSLICSTSFLNANAYGSVYVVIPEDGTQIAVYEKRDLLYAKYKTGTFTQGLESFSYQLENLATSLGYEPKGYKFTDAAMVNKAFAKATAEEFVTELAAAMPKTFNWPTYTKIFEKVKNNRFDYIASQDLTPATLKLSLHKYGSALGVTNVNSPHGKECWFSAKAILIPVSIFREILTELETQGHPIHKAYQKNAI
jgi:hypothetical protein